MVKVELYHCEDFRKTLYYQFDDTIEQPRFPEDYTKVAVAEYPRTDSDDQILEKIWESTNTIDHPWFERFSGQVIGGPHRSTSVGDIVVINDEPHVCVSIGWCKLKEYAKPNRR